jgi:hypothetical protein
VTNENSQVLDSNSPGGNFPDPTQTACFIRTQRYDQLFSDSGIYNVTRNSYADTVVSITQYNVQVIYPDTIVTVQPGYFDYAEPVFLSATDTSCSLQLNKHIIDDVTYIHNVTKNWDGELSSKVDNVIQVVYFPRPGQQWQDTDSIVVNFQYHQYWEVGDSLSVTYMSDVYWEKGDQVEVQYIYNPVTEAHLKPCAIRYEYYEIYNYTVAQLYYRSAVFTFPLYFMQNEPEPGEVLGRVDKLILEMLDWFLDPNVHLSE